MDIVMIGQRAWPPGHAFTAIEQTRQRDHLVMPLRGGALFQVADDQLPLRAGELLLIPSGLSHAWQVMGETPYEARWLQLRLAEYQREQLRYEAMPNGLVHLPLAEERNAALQPIMSRLLQLRGREGTAADELRELLVRALLQEIVVYHGVAQAPRSAVVAQALDHLDRHYAEADVGLSDLVRAVGCSRSVLMGRFTLEMGMPPMRYLEQRRLDIAADLLRYSQDSIASIASAVGYADSRYFATRFRRRFQCSPRLYRARA